MGGPDQVPFLFFFYSVPGFFFLLKHGLVRDVGIPLFFFYCLVFLGASVVVRGQYTRSLHHILARLYTYTYTRIHGIIPIVFISLSYMYYRISRHALHRSVFFCRWFHMNNEIVP